MNNQRSSTLFFTRTELPGRESTELHGAGRGFRRRQISFFTTSHFCLRYVNTGLSDAW